MPNTKDQSAKGMPQPAFSHGEITPMLHGRLDFEAYYKGLRTCRNMIPAKYGGVDNRPGTEFIGYPQGQSISPSSSPSPSPPPGLPDTYIEMKNVSFWIPPTVGDQPFPTTPAETNRILNTNDFDGNPTYWWEVIGKNSAGGQQGVPAVTEDYTLYLVDTDGNEYASITFPANTPDPTNWQIMERKRVQFTPPSGETTFAVKFNPVITGAQNNNPYMGAIRIIIKQEEETATKSMVQIPMQCLGDDGGGLENYYTYKEPIPGNPYPDYETVKEEYDWYTSAGLWKYESGELSSISKSLFEAVGGSPTRLLPGTNTGTWESWQASLVPIGNTAPPTPFWAIALFDEAEIEVPNSRASGSGSEMINFSALLPLTSGTYHLKVTYNGIDWLSLGTISWTVDHTPYDGNVHWLVIQNPWYTDVNLTNPRIGLLVEFNWHYLSADSPDTLSIALFDATVNEMVSGTELTWGADSAVSRKQVEFSPSLLVSGHEYEMRYKVVNNGGLGIFLAFESNLYLWVDPISALTVWQRVAMGEYEDYAGIDPAAFNDEARVLLNDPSGASVYFENVASFIGGSTSNPLYYRLVDAGTADFGRTGTPVPNSELTWLGTEDVNVRERKRSPALSLTDGNRYLTHEANNEDVLFQVQAFIVIKR